MSSTEMKVYLIVGLVFLFSVVKAVPLTDNFALFTDYGKSTIHQLELSTGYVSSLSLTTQGSPTGVAYDWKSAKVFWGSTNDHQLHSAYLNGSGYTLLSNTENYGGHPDRLAFDETTGDIYYTAVSVYRGITPWVGKITAAGVHSKLIEIGSTPRDIVLDPSDGFLFWTDHGNVPFIAKANMDGTDINFIVTNSLIWPNGLAIDKTEKMFYYTDGYLNVIKSCSYDGDCTTFLYDSGAHLMAIGLDETSIYYTGWNRQYITKVNRMTSTDVEQLAYSSQYGRLDSIVIYRSSMTQQGAPSSQSDPKSTTSMYLGIGFGVGGFLMLIVISTVVCVKCMQKPRGNRIIRVNEYHGEVGDGTEENANGRVFFINRIDYQGLDVRMRCHRCRTAV